MKIGSNQNPVSYSPTELNVVSENADTKKGAASKKTVDIMTDARAAGFAADGKITMGELKNSEPKKVILDWAITEEE
ncbi:hypothetical protein L0244_03015 [bacterium]|nr:hypothetical protein [bacterium]